MRHLNLTSTFGSCIPVLDCVIVVTHTGASEWPAWVSVTLLSHLFLFYILVIHVSQHKVYPSHAIPEEHGVRIWL